MSLWNSLRTAVLGVDLEAEQARGDQLDQKISVYQREQRDSNAWNEQQYQQAVAHQMEGTTGNVVGQVKESFDQGWTAGLDNISTGIKSTLNRIIGDPLSAVLGGLPWWLWAAGVIALFTYFGGFAWLKAKLLPHA